MEPTKSSAPTSRTDRTSAAILGAAAQVFREEGTGANLATVAATAGVGRATLYRYYASREALLDALGADAVAYATERIADAGLDRVGMAEAIGRIMRAMLAVGDRYAVLMSDHDTLSAAHEQLAAPIQAVLARGIRAGELRDDLPVEVQYAFLAGIAVNAIKLSRDGGLGLEEASAAAASFFLDGARTRRPTR